MAANGSNNTVTPSSKSQGSVLLISPHPSYAEVSLFITFAVLLTTLIISNNVMIMLAFKINTRLQKGSMAIILSLAVSDFLVGAISTPLWLYLTLNNWQAPYELLLFFTSFDIFSACASIFHLTAVSIERLIAVWKPFYHRVLSVRFYGLVVAAVWFAAAALTSCYPAVQFNKSWGKTFTILVFLLAFALPLTSISFVYMMIFKVLSTRVFPTGDAVTVGRHRVQREKKSALTGAIITGLFFIMWLPFFAVSLIAAFCSDCLVLTAMSSWQITVFVKSMHYSNSAVNTFVYAMRHGEVKSTFKRMLCLKNVRFNQLESGSYRRNARENGENIRR